MTRMRTLGRSGLETPPLILGGNVFGWTVKGEAAFAILDAFVAGGGRMIDSADVYSSWVPGNEGGESEALIGAWLKRRGRRDDVLISTKAGFAGGLSAPAIERAIDGSLRRLGTDYVDLYHAHVDDKDVPFSETLGAFDALVRAGKVRAIGASQISSERLDAALGVSEAEGLASYSVLQTAYGLLDRKEFEAGLQKVAVERGLGVLTYYSLANGYLTGKYRTREDLSKSVRGARAEAYMDGKGPAVLAALDSVAAQHEASPAQVALAWAAAQPGVTAPIASATSVAQVDELLGSIRIELNAEQLALLDEASPDE